MDRRVAYGLLILSACLFGASGVWGKALFHANLTPIQVTAFRTIVAGLCISLFAWWRGAKEFGVEKEQILFLAGFSALFTLVQLSFYLAVALTGIAIALTLQYTAPIFVVLWTKIRYGRSIGRDRLLSMAVALVGCAMIAQVGDLAFLSANLPGIVAGILSGLIFAAYNVMGNRVPERGIGTTTAALYSFGLSAVAWLVFLPVYSPEAGRLDPSAIGQIVFLGVGATFIPFVLLILGLRYVGAFEATLIGMMDPVAGGLLAYAFLGESLSFAQMIGMGLVLAAVAKASLQE